MKNRKKQIITIITIFTLLIYILMSFIAQNKTYADQRREAYNASKIENYQGYKELIENMRANHPNWNFTILYTGLDWNQVIKNETTAYHGRNLSYYTYSSSWFCPICGNKAYDNGSWKCASEAAVSYMMDPRNWINDANIFQFENLSYNGNIQTIDGVRKIINSMGYMSGNEVTYTKTDGTQGTINKSYAQIIMEAAEEAKISPYHLAARIKQEQGTGTTPGSTATGTYNGFVGYYNFLNIKASGSNTTQVITNGLTHARNNGWTDPEISIKEGAKVLAKNYINDGQDTLYLQKFDVDNSDGTLYYFQYMQNVTAAKTEAITVKSTYQELGLLNNSIDFIIPVYENMPDTPCQEPAPTGVGTQNIKVKGTSVRVRSGASTTSNILAEVNTGDVLLRIETASNKNEGYYWDKVVLPDGRQGYIARIYTVEIPDVTNCNETAIVTGTDVRLRNGPGTEGTTTITTLTKGQVVTIIEKGKYNLNGYNWARVKLPDGREGYIAESYLEAGNSTASSAELIKVICPSGLKVREFPGTDKKVLTYLDKNDILTRIEANASNANGYVWDKVVTSSGIEGYIARGTANETYIEVVGTAGNTGTNSETTVKNDNFKIKDNDLVCEPATTIDTIKEKYSDTNIIVKNASGQVVTSGNVGTGYTITIGNQTHTIIKKGDLNGDGNVKSTDYMKLKNYIMGVSTLSEVEKSAADANGDGNIKATDYMKIKNYIMGASNINI